LIPSSPSPIAFQAKGTLGSPPADPFLQVRELRKKYRGLEAVKGISFSVRQGEIFGLLGPDGSGKSTVIQILCGLLAPSSGSVIVNGVEVTRDPEALKPYLGYMAQGLGLTLFDNLSVEEHLDFFANLHQVPPAERKRSKEELLRITRLLPFRDRLAKNLSGGMKQKLALCSTLIHSPALLLLDEPTTGVDPLSRRDFWIIIGQLLREKRVTIVLSTSYMDEAERCHRVALLHEGEIVAQGTPEELRKGAEGAVCDLWARPLETVSQALSRRGWQVKRHRRRLTVRAPQGEDISLLPHLVQEVGGEALGLQEKPPDLEEAFLSVLTRKKGGLARSSSFLPPPLPGRPPSNGPAISVQGLTKRFDGFTAVAGIDFQVESGEIFGFLGPNGAGKTTTIKILCGIIPPSEGGGTISGFDILKERFRIKSRIGYMSQKFSLYRDLSVSENLSLYAGIYEVDRSTFRSRRDWILKLADLEGREGTLTGDLPLGLRQRLALGCALVHKPEILFLDEPTAGVDLVARQQFWELIWRLSREEGVTVLVTTHYLDEAEHCDRLAFIYAGRIIALGSPHSLKEETANQLGIPLYLDCADPLAAWNLLSPSYPRLFLYGRRLRIFSAQPEEDGPRIARLLQENGIPLISLEEEEIRLEDAFIHFVEREEERER